MVKPSASRLPAKAVVVLLIAVVMSAACGELEQPEAYSPSTSTTVAAGVEQQTASQVQEQPGVATRVDDFVPAPPPDYVPTLLVSGANYIFAVDRLGSVALTGSLADLQTARAVDDLGGGLVVQEIDGSIVYIQAQGEPEVLVETGARLLDVGHWGGSPRAFVELDSGEVEWIQLAERTASDRERQLHFELADDEEIVSFSASRNLQASVIQDSQCGELRFYNIDGEQLEFPGPPPPECVFPDRPVYGAVALSPDGGAVAYTIVSYRGDGTEAATELVARELVTGTEYFNFRIGEDLDVISSLTFDGVRAAYLKESPTNESVTIRDLSVDSPEVPVDLLDAGDIFSVSFARIQVAPVG